MKSIIKAMLEEIYTAALMFARINHQTIGEKRDYYITIEQLEMFLKEFET